MILNAKNTINANLPKGFVFILFVLIASLSGTVIAKSSEPVLVNWASEEGEQRFNRAIKKDFFKLANHFESQNNKAYCGVASSVIVLNALRVRNGEHQNKKPKADSVLSKDDLEFIPMIYSPFFERYTQDNVFVSGAKSRLEVLGKPVKQKNSDKEKRDFGFQLWQLQELLQKHDLKVVKVVAENNGLEQFREHVKKNLSRSDDYILVNYTRKALNQKGGGHISPLGAYDAESDSVLIMDVNSNKADWLWVSLRDLYKAMATFDTIENRGYLLISEQD